MGRLLLLLLLIHLGLAFAAIVDCLGGERRPERWSRFIWSLLIVFGLFAGPIAWFGYGRPGRKITSPWRLPGPVSPAAGGRPRPLAPDDDPDFLAGLGRQGGTGGPPSRRPEVGGPPSRRPEPGGPPSRRPEPRQPEPRQPEIDEASPSTGPENSDNTPDDRNNGAP